LCFFFYFSFFLPTSPSSLFPYTTLFRSESLSFTTSYNMAADSLRWYPISVNARTTLFEKINLTGSSHFDPYMTDSLGRRRNISRSEEHTSELQSRSDLVCRLLLEKKKLR